MLVSIQLNSNRPTAIYEFIENIEETASNPEEIEVLFHIDQGDTKCRGILEQLIKSSKVKIKYLETDIIKYYKDLWKPLNELLKLTDPNTYFVTNFSDEFRFRTKGWDDIIKKYIRYYEDDIFRIRLSNYRFRNYTDFWECVYAPDSLAFYTKKWMDTVGMWCPCLGPDSWQQLVSFYLINSRQFDHIQYNRDIAESFIKFEGEGASIGLTGLKAIQRVKDNLDLWFETVSHEMQEKAKYAAAMLQASIILHESKNNQKISSNFRTNIKPPSFIGKKIGEISFKKDEQDKKINFSHNGKIIYSISYKLSKTKFFLINNIRKLNYCYYGGGGIECFKKVDLISQINAYLRMRKYGNLRGQQRTITKPKFLKRSVFSFLWIPLKIVLTILEAIKDLIFKIPKIKKYYRFVRIKISYFLKKLLKKLSDKPKFYFFYRELKPRFKKVKKTTFIKNNILSLFWPLIKITLLSFHFLKVLISTIRHSDTTSTEYDKLNY